MSEKNRKSFTSQYKAKVALEAIRGLKTLLGVEPKSKAETTILNSTDYCLDQRVH